MARDPAGKKAQKMPKTGPVTPRKKQKLLIFTAIRSNPSQSQLHLINNQFLRGYQR